jgi:hypothetical protein
MADTPEQIAFKAAAAAAELAKRKKEKEARNKIASMFPDEGPFRRELYPKHMEFFKAGAKFKERLFMAANRCISPWTPIEMDHATRQCVELLGETGFYVRSWDGGSRCSRPTSSVFLKGIDPGFALLLDNGQVFHCSRKHQVLTHEGLIEVGQFSSRKWSALQAYKPRLSGQLWCG